MTSPESHRLYEYHYFYSHNTLTSYWMESSPASLTATHVYLPVSSACALGICNTLPPSLNITKFHHHSHLICASFSFMILSTYFIYLFNNLFIPGRIRTLSLEVSIRPSLYQVSVGGGTALLSQYRDRGLLRITSRTSPPRPGTEVLSPRP